MNDKKKFTLNEETRKKIESEYQNRKPESAASGRRRSEKKLLEDEYARAYAEAYARASQELDPDGSIAVSAGRRKKRRIAKILIITVTVCAVLLIVNISALLFRGKIWFNEPRKRDYPVRGVAVDEDLGEIDWKIMSQQTISFAYIRATKGTTLIDEQFESSSKNVKKTDLLIGYYHEFDVSADGAKQAEHFIEECGDMSGDLRPMVKLTKYGIYNLHMKNADDVRKNLQEFLDAVKAEYGRNCVIMCDSSCYKKYVKGYFENTLWLISYLSEPDEEETGWALWEFNPRVRSVGYANSGKYYALTVYRSGKDIENFKKNFLMD